MLFLPLKIKRAQAVFSDIMGGFNYKVSQDSCHCSISLNWKMIIYYKVQVKSFQTEECNTFRTTLVICLADRYITRHNTINVILSRRTVSDSAGT
jgi:hypothetical protein